MFPGVRRHRREVINKIVKIVQGVENFMEIQVSKGNERRHYTSFCKFKIMIIRPKNESISIIWSLTLRGQKILCHRKVPKCSKILTRF